MTDFEELHRWSVEQELRAPLAADSMRALRVKVAAMGVNAAARASNENAGRFFNTYWRSNTYPSRNDALAAAAGQSHFRYADASRAGLLNDFNDLFT